MITEFLPLITGAIGGATTAGVFRGPVKTLEDYWYITFGHSASEKAEKLRVKQEVNSELLKKQLLTEVSKIEEPNIQEPPLQILGPTLESSKYYIEEEEMRNMFAKLLASSMDKSKNDMIHNSFVEIIKQLSPLDAQLLKYIVDFPERFPLTKAVLSNKLGLGHKVLIPIYFFTDEYPNIEKNATSLSNLDRLGLIDMKFDTWIGSGHYNDIQKSEQATILKKANSNEDYSVKFHNGVIDITPYATNFIKTCM